MPPPLPQPPVAFLCPGSPHHSCLFLYMNIRRNPTQLKKKKNHIWVTLKLSANLKTLRSFIMLKFLSKNICLFLWFQVSFESLGNVLFTFSLKIFLKTSCNFRKKFAYVSCFIFVFVNGAFFFNWRLCVQAGFDFCMLMLHPVTLSNSLKSTLVC